MAWNREEALAVEGVWDMGEAATGGIEDDLPTGEGGNEESDTGQMAYTASGLMHHGRASQQGVGHRRC